MDVPAFQFLSSLVFSRRKREMLTQKEKIKPMSEGGGRLMYSELNGNTTTTTMTTMTVTPQASDDRNEPWPGIKVLARHEGIRRSHKDQPELLNQ